MTFPADSSPRLIVRRIVSGGQTGVDQAALQLAIDLGIDHGGWCPRGRRCEAGQIPSRFRLVECQSRQYAARTKQNVVDSDATLILFRGQLSGGTLLTQQLAQQHQRPSLTIDLELAHRQVVAEWIVQHRPATLNVAGPRESGSPGIHTAAYGFLLTVFGDSRALD